jgi:3',5'-cyclic AMP phosphodiesterase CpdA
MNRRNFFGMALAAGVVSSTRKIQANVSHTRPKRVLRVAHLTDIHVDSLYNSEQGASVAFNHVCNLQDQPDFIITGGDHIADALKRGKPHVKNAWKIYNSVVESECKIPIYPAIGNHDIFGWALSTQPDKVYGKLWAMDELKMKERYYYFDTPNNANWRFIVLDSCQFDPKNTYTAKLDDEQFEWLESVLNNTPSNVNISIVTHVPIISSTSFFDGRNESSGKWVVPSQWMHIDARDLKNLFKKHQNVKLALSGHIHMHDEINFMGVKYLCNGAVCGAWWNGHYYDFPPAYVVLDLFDDGSSKHYFVPYGEMPNISNNFFENEISKF